MNETFSEIFKTLWKPVKTGLIGGFCRVVFGSDLCYTFKSELEISFVFPPRSSAPISPIVSDASTEKSTNFWSFWPRFARTATASTRQLPQCLKITEKVSFNIASEESYVYVFKWTKVDQKCQKCSILTSFWKCDIFSSFQTMCSCEMILWLFVLPLSRVSKDQFMVFIRPLPDVISKASFCLITLRKKLEKNQL